MQIEQFYPIYLEHPTVTTDSRNIPENSLFFALKGTSFNGNLFATEALDKGAAYAIVDEPACKTNERCILVDDVLSFLQKLARFHRDQLKLPILAITGTNGKTTTKELVASVLSRKFRINYTKGNLNNHIGVPLTLLSMNKDTEMGIVEMGANHPGEIRALCEIADPDYGIVTNIGKAHLEGFGSFEGVIRTKSELYEHLRAKGGKCIINADNELLNKQAFHLEKITYGQSTSNFLAGELADSSGYLTVKALFPKGWLYLKTKLVGNYNLENVLAAACAGKYFGVDPLQIQDAIGSYSPSNNRSQLIKSVRNIIIMDAYNANPTSMMAALVNFMSLKEQPKCLILGDMLELGTTSGEEHQKIVDFIERNEIADILLVGPEFGKTTCHKKEKKFEHVELLSNYLKTQPIENKLILIKGSRGIHLETVLDQLTS